MIDRFYQERRELPGDGQSPPLLFDEITD